MLLGHVKLQRCMFRTDTAARYEESYLQAGDAASASLILAKLPSVCRLVHENAQSGEPQRLPLHAHTLSQLNKARSPKICLSILIETGSWDSEQFESTQLSIAVGVAAENEDVLISS